MIHCAKIYCNFADGLATRSCHGIYVFHIRFGTSDRYFGQMVPGIVEDYNTDFQLQEVNSNPCAILSQV